MRSGSKDWRASRIRRVKRLSIQRPTARTGNLSNAKDNMPTKQTAFRLDSDLLARIDVFLLRQQRANPGQSVSVSDAVRILLEYGLSHAGLPSEGDRSGRPGVPMIDDEKPIPELMTVSDIAAKLCMTRHAVHGMVSRNEVPGLFRIGRRLRFNKPLVERWIKQRLVSARQQGTE